MGRKLAVMLLQRVNDFQSGRLDFITMLAALASLIFGEIDNSLMIERWDEMS
jgi:hypothetical protein